MKNKKYDVFISYETTTGKTYAENLKKALEKEELKVFLASDELRAGKEWEKEILLALESCEYFIIIITTSAPQSGWVKKECKKALELNKRIIPCRYKGVKIEDTEEIIKELPSLQQIEFEDKYELANKVIEEIKEIKNKEKKGITISQDAKEFWKRGILFMWLKKYEEAKKEFEKAIKIDPNFVMAHYGLGISLFLLKRWDEAEKKFEEIKEKNPNFLYYSEGMLFVIYVIKVKMYLEKILKIMSNWQDLFKRQGMVREVELMNEIIKDFQKEWEYILSIEIDKLLEKFKEVVRLAAALYL